MESTQAPLEGAFVEAKEDKKQKKWIEVLLFLFGVAVFAPSFYLYYVNFPLHEYIFDLDLMRSGVKVGVLSDTEGSTRRKFSNRSDFNQIEIQEDLFNFDTIVTDSASNATLKLEDDTEIVLEENTMVQLAFLSGFGLSGIQRTAEIRVVSGKVKGKAGRKNKLILKSKDKSIVLPPVATPAPGSQPKPTALAAAPARPQPVAAFVPKQPAPKLVDKAPVAPPKPEPVVKLPPVKVALTSPPDGKVFRVPDGSIRPKVDIPFKWNLSTKEASSRVRIVRVSDGFGGWVKDREEVIHNKIVQTNGVQAAARIPITKPGVYEWQVYAVAGGAAGAAAANESDEEEIPANGKKIQTRKFKIEPYFNGIKSYAPLIAGGKSTTNMYSGKKLKDFSLTYRWNPYPTAKNYLFRFYRRKTDKSPIFEKSVRTTSYVTNRKKIFTGKVFYTIDAKLPSGFVVRSGLKPFRFDFRPPLLVNPGNQQNFTLAQLKKNKGKILFTWQRTDFTENYLLEFSTDVRFDNIYKTLKLKENFLFEKSPKPGTYYWRAKSQAQGVESIPSPVRSFSVGKKKSRTKRTLAAPKKK